MVVLGTLFFEASELGALVGASFGPPVAPDAELALAALELVCYEPAVGLEEELELVGLEVLGWEGDGEEEEEGEEDGESFHLFYLIWCQLVLD